MTFSFCLDCEISELEDVLGQEAVQTPNKVKGVGQQLLLLQDQVSVSSHGSPAQMCFIKPRETGTERWEL